MGRTVVKREAVSMDNTADEVQKAPQEGGTSGAPDEPMRATSRIGGPVVTTQQFKHPSPEKRAEIPPRFFKVMSTLPETVMYDGARVRVHYGKVFPEQSCDLDRLRGQGVVLAESDAHGVLIPEVAHVVAEESIAS